MTKTEFVLAMILHVAQPDLRPPDASPYPEARETHEARAARYQAIAEDIAAEVFDPAAAPVYWGPFGRVRTAALVVSVAWNESGFARDVDVGPCAPGRVRAGQCDHGRSASMWQIKIGRGRTREGWTQADLFSDRRKAIRAALRGLRSSFGLCKHLEEELRLTAYGTGSCEEPLERSRPYIRLGNRLAALNPRRDEEIQP